jgi:hypothetical protein
MTYARDLRDAIETLAKALAPALARAIVAELRDGDGMVEQGASPLGARRHRAAVRRRVAAGEGGAAVIGRRHLLSREALTEELERVTRRPVKDQGAPPSAESLASELGLHLVGGKRR